MPYGIRGYFLRCGRTLGRFSFSRLTTGPTCLFAGCLFLPAPAPVRSSVRACRPFATCDPIPSAGRFFPPPVAVLSVRRLLRTVRGCRAATGQFRGCAYNKKAPGRSSGLFSCRSLRHGVCSRGQSVVSLAPSQCARSLARNHSGQRQGRRVVLSMKPSWVHPVLSSSPAALKIS